MNDRDELLRILHDSRELLARAHNDYSWSSWEDAAAALAELDQRIAEVARGELPRRLDLDVLYAATGPMQELSLSSGWPEEFLALAERFDKVAHRVWRDGS